MSGKAVLVAIGNPGDARDTEYLRVAVQIEVAERGGRVVDDRSDADVVAAILVGAIDLDASGRFMGLKGTESSWLPFTIPEIALYKSRRIEGFAKAEIAIIDTGEGGGVFVPSPVQGTTFTY